MALIDKLLVAPRPRSAWQAIDAGFALAREHYIALLCAWLLSALPLFLVYVYLDFTLGWVYLFFVWWWLKPLFELPVHFYLSRAIFSEKPTVLYCWKETYKNFWRLFLSYLTIARFSPARSMTYAVVFLEKLPYKQRSTRVGALLNSTNRSYVLMLACLHVEQLLLYGMLAMILLFFPSLLDLLSWDIFDTVSRADEFNWINYTTVLASFAAVALTAPFYVAGGFMLYINRRMELEAWDIEHRFKDINTSAQRKGRLKTNNTFVQTATLIAVVGLSIFASPDSIASDLNRANTIPTVEENRKSIKDILAHKDFGSVTTAKRLTLKDREYEKNEDEDDASKPSGVWASILRGFADGFQILIWVFAIICVVLLFGIIRSFRPNNMARSKYGVGDRDIADATAHPLTSNLPDDIVGAARDASNAGDPRQALSLLFRGALRSTMTQHELKINKGATEADCKKIVASHSEQSDAKAFDELVHHWQLQAYAHRQQSSETIEKLVDSWSKHFQGNSNAAQKVTNNG